MHPADLLQAGEVGEHPVASQQEVVGAWREDRRLCGPVEGEVQVGLRGRDVDFRACCLDDAHAHEDRIGGRV